MANRRLRLVRESILELPQFRDVSNQTLTFRPDSPLAIVTDEVADNELVQSYLAQGLLVEIDENGEVKPPPAAAPVIQSDAEKGLTPPRQSRGAGANPEDGTGPRPGKAAAPQGAGLSQNRQARGAGANPEDGTASRPGGIVSPNTGVVQKNVSAALQQTAGKPAEEAPTAIDVQSPQMQAAQGEAAFRKETASATPGAAEELASRREAGTLDTETPATHGDPGSDPSRGGVFGKKNRR